jgi:hypothetical protein
MRGALTASGLDKGWVGGMGGALVTYNAWVDRFYRMIGPLRSVKTTGTPALITVGPCAVIISMQRLSRCTAMPITAIRSAATKPTDTILRWVMRSAVFIDQFMTISNANADFSGLSLEQTIFRLTIHTSKVPNKKCEKSQTSISTHKAAA